MTRVRVEVLGAFRLFVDGDVIEVQRRQVQLLLGWLAATGQPATVDTLIDLLWPERIPRNPEASLRVAISRARGSLGPASDALSHSAGTYALDTTCDAIELTTGHGPETTESLQRLLVLWRGEPFEGLGDTDRLRVERQRLSSRRETVHVSLVTTLWDSNEAAQVEQLARSATAVDPSDQLMTAYLAQACARSGRQSEALRVIDKCRGVLRERGLAVSPMLSDVEGQILTGSVDITHLAEIASDDGGASTVVGRADTVGAILAAVDAGQTVGLVGEAGIGKTALLDVLLDRARSRGNQVYVVAAPASADRPLHTLAALAESVLKDRSAEEIAPRHAAALQRVLPSWKGPDQGDVPRDRDDLIGRLVDLVAGTTGEPVVVIDDLHWIDESSAQGIRQLIQHSSMRVVVASRPSSDHGHAAVEQVLDLLDETHLLGPLDVDDVRELFDKDYPELEFSSIASVFDRSGGNPFFVRQLAELIVEGASMNADLPPSVLVAVRRRLGVLTPATQRVVERAAILGEEFSVSLLTNWSGSGAAEALAEADAAGLIQLDPSGDAARFRHALIADGAVQMLSGAQRIALHDEAGRRLEAAGAPASATVRHAVEAVDLDPQRAFDSSANAAEQYVALFSWEQALIHAEFALDLLDTGRALAQHRSHLLYCQGQAQFALGMAGSYESLVTAAEHAISENTPAVLAKAMVEICHHGSLVLTGVDPKPALAMLDETLTSDAPQELIVQVQAAASRLLAYSKDHRRGQDLYKLALAELDHVKDLHTRRVIFRHAEHGLAHPADHGLACQFLERYAEHADDPQLANHAMWFRFQRAMINADVQQIKALQLENRRREEHGPRTASYVLFGQTTGQAMQMHWAESSISLMAGHPERAEAHANEALQAGLAIIDGRGDSFGRGWVVSGYGTLLLAIRSAQGRLSELRPLVEQASAAAPGVLAWRAVLAAVCHAQDDRSTARALLAEFVADDFACLTPDATWTATTWLLATPVADLLPVEASTTLYAAMVPYQDRMSFSGFTSLGPMHTALAILADRLGQHTLAQSHRDQATKLIEQLHAIELA